MYCQAGQLADAADFNCSARLQLPKKTEIKSITIKTNARKTYETLLNIFTPGYLELLYIFKLPLLRVNLCCYCILYKVLKLKLYQAILSGGASPATSTTKIKTAHKELSFCYPVK
jgi:hypothetical protein